MWICRMKSSCVSVVVVTWLPSSDDEIEEEKKSRAFNHFNKSRTTNKMLSNDFIRLSKRTHFVSSSFHHFRRFAIRIFQKRQNVKMKEKLKSGNSTYNIFASQQQPNNMPTSHSNAHKWFFFSFFFILQKRVKNRVREKERKKKVVPL